MTTIIDTTNITDGTLTGTGSFDLLMQSVKAHIEYEYNAGRIVGTDYANVYLGTIQTVLGQAIQFELSKASAAAQTDLVLEQILTQEQQTILATNAVAVSTATIQANIDLAEANTDVTQEQVNTQIAQTSMLGAQETKLTTVDTSLVNKQIDNISAQLSLTGKQEAQVEAQTLNVPKQGLIMDQEYTNLVSQNKTIELQDDHLEAQIANTLANTEVLLEKGGFR